MTVQNHSGSACASRQVLCLAIALFITFMLIIPVSQAYTVKEVKITNQLGEDASVAETLEINIISSQPGENFTFKLPAYAREVVADYQRLPDGNNTISKTLDCTDCHITVSYTVNSVIRNEKSGLYSYSRTLDIPSPETLVYRVMLPPGYMLLDSEEANIVPPPTSIETDGIHIVIRWSENKPELPKRYYIKYSDHEGLEKSGSEIANELGEWPVWIIIIISITVGIAMGLIFEKYYLRKFRESDVPYVPLSLLSPDEKIVLKAIKEYNTHNDQRIHQKELAKNLNWSKSKLSAILTNLEHKQVIAREKFGRNYRIEIIRPIEE